MKAVRHTSLRRQLWSGPAAGVLVALAGAALVAIGMLLLGAREATVSLWNPTPPAMAQAS